MIGHEFKPFVDNSEYCVAELPDSGDTCNQHVDDHRVVQHRIETDVKVYLVLEDGRWEIDPVNDQGDSLDTSSYVEGAQAQCGNWDEACGGGCDEAAANAAMTVDRPTLPELLDMLRAFYGEKVVR